MKEFGIVISQFEPTTRGALLPFSLTDVCQGVDVLSEADPQPKFEVIEGT